MFSLTLQNETLKQSLQSIIARGLHLDPFMKAVGESLVASTKQRFIDSKAPDGTPWAPNTETTLARYLAKYSGSFTKKGSLSKRGQQRLSSKKPLIGETKSLSTTINWRLDGNVLYVGSPMEYAAHAQFGAKRGAYGIYNNRPTPWGDTPARPYLGLSAEDEETILNLLEEYLSVSEQK